MRFLSGEWLDRLARAVADVPAPAHVTLSVHQRVTGGPDGDVEYTVRLDDGTLTVQPGPGPAEVELVEDYATATAISQGRLSPAEAFAAGRLRLRGDIDRLVEHQDALASVGRVLAALPGATMY